MTITVQESLCLMIFLPYPLISVRCDIFSFHLDFSIPEAIRRTPSESSLLVEDFFNDKMISTKIKERLKFKNCSPDHKKLRKMRSFYLN